jgi:DNA-binding NtrC family response regulator
MKRPYILCVDDEKYVLDSMCQQLKWHFGQRYHIEKAENADEALMLIDELLAEGEEVAMVISDVIMPDIKGDDLLVSVHKLIPEAVKIIVSGMAPDAAITKAQQAADLYEFIQKPWSKEKLINSLEMALGQQETRHRS